MSTHRNTLPVRFRATSPWRSLVAVAALLLAGAVSACSDAPVAPSVGVADATPSLAKGGKKGGSKPGEQQTSGTATQDSVWPGTLLSAPVTANAVLRTTPLADTVKAAFRVTSAGGQYTLPGTGLSLWVPPFAIPGDTLTITVAAVPGDVLAYRFGPHGTQFKKSLIMWQDLRGTNYLSRGTSPTFSVGYFDPDSDVNPLLKSALVRELQQHMFDAGNARLFWAVNHFSGYMVSWGLDSYEAF